MLFETDHVMIRVLETNCINHCPGPGRLEVSASSLQEARHKQQWSRDTGPVPLRAEAVQHHADRGRGVSADESLRREHDRQGGVQQVPV